MTSPTAAAGFGAAGIASTILGGMLGAKGAEQQGEAQQKMYNYRAQVALINANIDKQNAAWATQRGEVEATQYGMKAAQQRGAIRAAQGASGIEIGSGSNKAVAESQEKITQIDTAQIRANAAKIAYDYDTKSTMDTNQASLETIAGQNAKTAGDLGATQSIIGTVGTVSSKWAQGSQIGLWGGKNPTDVGSATSWSAT